VIGNLAADSGLPCLFQEDADFPEEESKAGRAASRWAVVAKRAEDLGTLKTDARWEELEGNPAAKVWTDDYSSVLPLLDFRLR